MYTRTVRDRRRHPWKLLGPKYKLWIEMPNPALRWNNSSEAVGCQGVDLPITLHDNDYEFSLMEVADRIDRVDTGPLKKTAVSQ